VKLSDPLEYGNIAGLFSTQKVARLIAQMGEIWVGW
jgi:hypothetical protein